MSRSHGASTEPFALTTAPSGGSSRGLRLVHRGRLEHFGLGVPRASKRGLLRIAIAIVPLATANVALASSGRPAHPTRHNPTIHRSATTVRARATGAHRIVAARDRLLREMRRDSDVVLSRGSGYGTAAGSPLVRALQIQLSRGGYRPGSIDGLYGPRTQASVAAFQGSHGLVIDGIAGSRTLGELTARTPVLYPGAGASTGGVAPVRTLQRRLARARYSPGPIDGIFGPATEQAVRRYQAAHGLPANGIAGTRTMARLHPRPVVGPPRHRIARPKSARPRTRPPHRTSVPRRISHPSSTGQPHSQPAGGTSSGWELPAEIAAAGLLLLTGAWYLRRRRGARPDAVPTERRGDAPPESIAAADTPPPEADQLTPEADQLTPEASPWLPETNGADQIHVEEEFERAGERAEAVIAFNTAVSLEQQHDRAGARAAYERAERAGHAGAASNLGVMMELDGDVEAAQGAYARADQRGDANGAFNLGCLLDEQGDVAGALDAYERADQRGHAEAATNLGVLMEVSGNIAKARAAYERAEQRGDPNGAANLGSLLEELGERGAAKAAYRRAKRMRRAPGRETTTVSSRELSPSEEPSPT
jgi:peptidoglycan hydrolase-like protein with peptidoglycan-binding domain